jgi:hypothetical protein
MMLGNGFGRQCLGRLRWYGAYVLFYAADFPGCCWTDVVEAGAVALQQPCVCSLHVGYVHYRCTKRTQREKYSVFHLLE